MNMYIRIPVKGHHVIYIFVFTSHKHFQLLGMKFRHSITSNNLIRRENLQNSENARELTQYMETK